MRDVVDEKNGEFLLPIAGFEAYGFKYLSEYAALLVRSADRNDEAEILVAPPDLHHIVVSLAAERACVRDATVSKASTLKVTFESGAILEVPASEYENWEMRGPGEILVVAPAGGGEPAIWDAKSKTYRLVDGQITEVKGEIE